MRAYDQGCFFMVQVFTSEVYAFSRRWPCSGLPDRGVSFTFDKRDGGLVDTTCPDCDAALALSQDAQAYGAKRLGVTL